MRLEFVSVLAIALSASLLVAESAAQSVDVGISGGVGPHLLCFGGGLRFTLN
jgi:hypothetical protein